MKKEFFDGKKVLVMGLGRFGGGVDVAKFVARAGAKVIVTDLLTKQKLIDSISQLDEFPDIEYHLGSHDPADFLQADIIIANPAVPPDNEFLQLARQHKKIVTSQIGIFFELCPAMIIGITGANGKSTTAALTAHLLKSASDERRATSDEHVWLSGNIGNEPLLTVVEQIAPFDLVVLELSSFQLEQLAQAQKAPQVALLTNLTPNHLDRYGTFADYCAAKENIFRFQKPSENSPAVSIFNAEDKVSAEWFEKYSVERTEENSKLKTQNSKLSRICIKFSTDDVSRQIRDSFKLPGRANLSNLAAANAVAKYFGVDEQLIRNSLPEFKPLPHRLELVCRTSGVRGRGSGINSKLKTQNSKLIDWYNDSKATTPQSAIAALEAFDRPIIIIAGGYDKHLPFDEFGRLIAEKAKAAILLGQTAPKIAEAIKEHKSIRAQEHKKYRISNIECRMSKCDTHDARRTTKIEIVKSLPEAVQLANRLAETGDVILLSPACASYDMFDNFEQRGCEFKRLVRETVNRA